MSVINHSVFVLAHDGKPLTPTTPSRARKLLKTGAAKPTWSKFGTFGVRLATPSRQVTPLTTLGVDHGTKFEGYAVVAGNENVLSVKLDLPEKKKIVKKLHLRHILRRGRRFRTCRRRPTRFQNRRRRADWLAPSQAVIVASRLRLLAALFALYPIRVVAIEDVRFNHSKHRWGANFSTVEIGKARIRSWLEGRRTNVTTYVGWETQALRVEYGYHKSSDKAGDRFEAHCTDALALACHIGPGHRVNIGPFVVVDDTYRPVRRRLHDTQPARGSVRAPYSRGTVCGYRKGLLIGIPGGQCGRLCGENHGFFRYYNSQGKRQTTRTLAWASTQFIVRGVVQTPAS